MGVLAGLRAQFCEHAMRGSPGPHPTLLVFTNIKCSPAVMVDIYVRISEGPGANIVYSRAQYGEILTARQSTAASCSAWVAGATQQTHINLDDEHVKTGNL